MRCVGVLSNHGCTMRQISSPNFAVTSPALDRAQPAAAAMTSTTWADIPTKGKSRKGAAAMAAGAAVVALLLVSGVALYARSREHAGPATGLVPTAPSNREAESSPPLAATASAPTTPSVAPQASEAASAAPDNVQTAITKPPARTVDAKAPAPSRAPSPPATAAAPASAASAPALWNGRK